MNLRALHLPRIPLEEARARALLGGGRWLRLTHPQPAVLLLKMAPAPLARMPGQVLACAVGRLWLSDAEAMLSQLSECPAILGDSNSARPDNDWYWALYNQYLDPQLQTLLSPLRTCDDTLDEGLDVLVQLDSHTYPRLTCHARMTARVLLALLHRAEWQACEQSLDPAIPLTLGLILGSCRLTLSELATLRLGDVVLFERALITHEGLGQMQVGNCRLHLQMLPGTSWRFTVVELENHMDATTHVPAHAQEAQDDIPQPDNDLPDVDSQISERFDDLPLQLTLKAGHLTLALKQLRSLAPGSVLHFEGCQAGDAWLCLGERTLARGELVDIDGSLGLRITELEPKR